MYEKALIEFRIINIFSIYFIAPTIDCPQAMRFDSTSDVTVNFPEATARDSQNNPLTVEYSYSRPVTGQTQTGNLLTVTFPVGVTTVTALSAPDANNQRALCTFTVTGKFLLICFHIVP